MTLQAINRFKIARHVPAEGSISYKELSALTSVPESQLRRLLRHAITHRIFCEPEKEKVAHSVSSRLLAEDPQMDSLLYFLADIFWPTITRAVDAFQKWPGSQNPKEAAITLVKGRETTFFAEVAAADRGIQSFRDTMEVISHGKGVEDSYLVDNFPWGQFGKGTIVDASIV